MKIASCNYAAIASLGTLLCGTALPALAQEDPIVLDAIVLTATGFAQQIVDAPATITVIDSKDIADEPYSSVADIVRDVPGVIVGSPSSRSGAEQISIRGLGEEYVLILVDGKPIGNSQEATYNGFGSGLAKTMLPPPTAIERVEVIRGPMSSLYGSSASGGVINIITKPVSDVWAGSMTIGSTSYKHSGAGDTKEARFYLSGPLISDRLGLALFGSYHNRNKDEVEFSSRGSILTQQQEITRKSLGARLTWAMSDLQELRFEVLSGENDTYTIDQDGGEGGITSERMN